MQQQSYLIRAGGLNKKMPTKLNYLQKQPTNLVSSDRIILIGSTELAHPVYVNYEKERS